MKLYWASLRNRFAYTTRCLKTSWKIMKTIKCFQSYSEYFLSRSQDHLPSGPWLLFWKSENILQKNCHLHVLFNSLLLWVQFKHLQVTYFLEVCQTWLQELIFEEGREKLVIRHEWVSDQSFWQSTGLRLIPQTWELAGIVFDLDHRKFLIARWLDRPAGVWKVMSLTPTEKLTFWVIGLETAFSFSSFV